MLAIRNLLICHSKTVQEEWNLFMEEIDSKFDSKVIEKKKIGFPESWKDYLLIHIEN